MQDKCLHLDFDPDSPQDRQEITEYCFSDCDGCVGLFPRLKGKIAWSQMAHWAEFLKTAAHSELRGIPIDAALFRRVIDNKDSIRQALIDQINKTHPLFDHGVFKGKRFLRWCDSAGIKWPVKESPRTGKWYRPLDDDTFNDMSGRHPFIQAVRQVRKTLKQLDNRSMVIDEVDGRHYFGTHAFRSVTGRNQPRAFLFSGPKWLRWLVVPESPDHVLVYVDYVAQEIGVAAALSGGVAMRQIYEASDCHMAFAIRAGAAPADATKVTHAAVRKQYKTVNLGVLYGQTAHGIGPRLGIGRISAQRILDDHQRLFPTFWGWSERVVQRAFNSGTISTPCGWRSRVPPLSNERTWMNFPMQATGTDIMRLTMAYAGRQNVRLLAPVHDGFY